MPSKLAELHARTLALAERLDWLPFLLSRLTIGGIFLYTGWSKLTHLDVFIQFLESLGIPAPGLQAPLVASTEFGCGLLVLLGWFTRLASLPLIATMTVAIVAVKVNAVRNYSDFLSLSEYLLIVILVWLAVKGGGDFSLDRTLGKRRGKSPRA